MKKHFASLILFVMVSVGVYYFLGPKDLYVAHDCQIQETGRCTSSLEGVQLNFELLPLPINPTSELTYQLDVDGIEVEKVTVRLLGHDMRMEEQQIFDLERKAGNTFAATRVFPLCTEEGMLWRLYLIIEAKNLTLRTLYDLRVKRG